VPILLHITVSPRGNHSISRQLGAAAVREWKERNPGGRVVERDLAKTSPSFVDSEWIVGASSSPETHTEGHKRAITISDELISELKQADEIVLDTPMYNFAIPAVLKAWIDHVVRAGKTFRYTSAGTPEGLLAGKNIKVLVIIASGGKYTGDPGLAALDYEAPYLRFILGFMGITDVRFIQAGGTGAVMHGSVSAGEFIAPYLTEVAATVSV
jgi:FMN-dependent NADH-azoreductase